MIMAMVVVLPAPLPPSRPTIAPRGTEKLMPSTATTLAVGLDEVGDGDGRGFGAHAASIERPARPASGGGRAQACGASRTRL